jgi:mannosyl-oligosaccharide alpha-1,2-mannosidase
MTQMLFQSRGRKPLHLLILAAVITLFYFGLRERWLPASAEDHARTNRFQPPKKDYSAIKPLRPERYPPDRVTPLPTGKAVRLPRVQHQFTPETRDAKAERERRASAVRDAFLHAWAGYKKYAWMKDELAPITGEFKSPFCGWAATLVDSLDTLLIMGLHDEFEEALKELYKIDFTGTEGCVINLFEMTIRHLGGLLATYDVSEGRHEILLSKAVEVGEILYTAFDTPNRMPSPHYLWSAYVTSIYDCPF